MFDFRSVEFMGFHFRNFFGELSENDMRRWKFEVLISLFIDIDMYIRLVAHI